jgi:hypothetical protein
METFQQATESLAYSGAIASGSASVKMTRIGDLVSMTIPEVLVVAPGALAAQPLFYGAISANFRPAAITDGYAAVYNNSTTAISTGSFRMHPQGLLVIGTGPNTLDFSANPGGVAGQTFTWHAAPL